MLKQNCTNRNGLKTRPACILEVIQMTGKIIMKYTHVIQRCVASADEAVTLNNLTIKNILICAHVQRERMRHDMIMYAAVCNMILIFLMNRLQHITCMTPYRYK
jgi:hypothetical protein